jgi:hypothetical protein
MSTNTTLKTTVCASAPIPSINARTADNASVNQCPNGRIAYERHSAIGAVSVI